MYQSLKNYLLRLHRDERGAMSVEKILILAVISIPLIIVLFLFRNKIVEWFGAKSQAIESDSNSAPNYQ